jgi:hypothetical protein
MLEVFFWPPQKLEEVRHMSQELAGTDKCPARARLPQSSHERPHPIRRIAILIRPKPLLRQRHSGQNV